MHVRLAAAAGALILLTASGCGSSSDKASTTPANAAASTTSATSSGTPASTADAKAAHNAFIKRVNPICADYNRSVRNVQRDLQAVGKTGNVDVYVGPLERATKAAQRASDRFNALKAPAAETEQAALIGRALKAQAKGNDILLKAARADDPQEFGVATQALQQVTPQLQELMRAYGMTVCGAAG